MQLPAIARRTDRRRGRDSLLLLGLLASGTALAEPIVAQRTARPIHLDGKLGDPGWDAAPVFDAFVENFPRSGARPDLRTEVRVLFDDSSLYVGVRCFDSDHAGIVRSLGRRDANPPSDLVELALDSSGDHRTAYDFVVNAAGVQRDLMFYADFNSTDTWDAVWDAEVSVDAQGWTVEYRIPLRILRISRGAAWRVEVRRVVTRTHQIFESTLIPREANPALLGAMVVSRFGPLEGLESLDPIQDFELTPYLAARASLRPRFSDPTVPQPRLWDPSFDVGADLKVALTSRLSLNAALNPDFGQVEADRVIQNLSTAEAFFPEKRPFFLQGLDVFQPVGAEYGSQQQLFYSRRVGLREPILGALKVTGSITDTLDVGVLDSVVLGASNPALAPVAFQDPDAAALQPFEASPDQRFQFHPATPFHLGPNDALPADRPTPRNYFAAVARQRLGEASSLGATFTASTPLAPRCTPGDFATPAGYAAVSCHARGANAFAVDWNLRTASGEWGFLGQAELSQQVGGDPAGRTLPDGVVMYPDDLGYGGYFRAGKLGGEPFRFDVSAVLASPKLDLNGVGMGFQPLSNIQWADLALHYTRPNGVGPFRSLSVDAFIDLNWSADGLWLPRGLNGSVRAEAQLPGYEVVGLNLGLDWIQFDTREITGAGVAFQRLPELFAVLYGQTDASKPFYLYLDLVAFDWLGLGPQPNRAGVGGDLTLRWQPLDALETRIDAGLGYHPVGARYLDGAGPESWVFGSQIATNFTVTLRQQVVITPRLSFQVYAQLFSGAAYYEQYWKARPLALDQRSLAADQLLPYVPAGSHDEHTSTLNLNAVLRWEYRLGSTLYVVYSRSQNERVPAAGGRASTSLFPSQLFSGPATDTFLIKFTYWWTA